MSAAKLSRKRQQELRLIADSTYEAILATAAKAPKIREKTQRRTTGR